MNSLQVVSPLQDCIVGVPLLLISGKLRYSIVSLARKKVVTLFRMKPYVGADGMQVAGNTRELYWMKN